MTTTSTDVTPQQRLTIIKHLAGGKALDQVALITRLPEAQVLDIASHHGYPKTESLAKAAEILQRNIDQDRRDTIPTGSTIPEPRPLPHATAGAASTPAPAVLTRPDEIRVLLNTAKGHPSKKIQAQADRCLDAISRLRDLIKADEDQNAEKRRVAAERQAARVEVDRLKAQLAEATAKLRGTTPSTDKVPSGQAAVIRAWAAKQGIDVPSRGRIPAPVREQYAAEHQQAAS